MSRHPVSPKGVLLVVVLELFKVSKITNFNYDLFKVSKMNNFNYDLFKVSKMYFLKLEGFFGVNAYVYIPTVVLFLWLKIAINFQNWVYMGMVDIFLLGILGGCPRLLHNTLLKAWSINV